MIKIKVGVEARSGCFGAVGNRLPKRFTPWVSRPAWTACVIIGLLQLFLTLSLKAQANMRREGALTLNQTSDDTKGFYSATIDPANGFAYFAAKYVYKVVPRRL